MLRGWFKENYGDLLLYLSPYRVSRGAIRESYHPALSESRKRFIDCEVVRIKVVIIAKHRLIREALRGLLKPNRRLIVVADAGTRTRALSITTQEQPAIILIDGDFSMGKELRFMRELSRGCPDARFVVLVDNQNADTNPAFINRGVKGLISKHESGRILIKAIEKVYAGEVWLTRRDTSAALEVFDHPRGEDKLGCKTGTAFGLTPREFQILELVAQGLRNRQIAQRVGTKESTVRHQISSIFAKCEITSRFELILFAFREGPISLEAMIDVGGLAQQKKGKVIRCARWKSKLGSLVV